MIISTNRAACIELTKNKNTGCFELGRGNAQGDVVSPFLFNIGYQILLLKLEKDENLTGF
jgi:predicted nucleotide-binding protein (sugar kinase/HSP70/actin superfamily)